MKNVYILFIPLMLLYSCGTTSSVNQSSQEINSNSGSFTYETIIQEPGFNSWLKEQQPKSEYELNFLEKKNAFFVNSYNNRVNKENYNKDLYPWEINYNSKLNYGIEVNYSLYHYFLYFQEKYKQTL